MDKDEFVDKLREFSNIVLSKDDTLDLLYDIEHEENFFRNEATYRILIEQENITYFYKNLDQMHCVVDMCCLRYIKKQNNESITHSPYSFYEFDAMQEYYSNLKYLFNEIYGTELPAYFDFIIDWIILRAEEVDNYNIFINNQIEKTNKMHIDSLLNVFIQQTEEIQNDVNKTLSDAKESISLVESTAQTNIKTAIENIEITQKAELQKTEKKSMENSITILGIFSAIVLVANTGISISTDVLQNLITADISKAALIFSVFGVILGNVVLGLISYLEHVRTEDETKSESYLEKVRTPVCCLNIVLGFVAILLTISLFFDAL